MRVSVNGTKCNKHLQAKRAPHRLCSSSSEHLRIQHVSIAAIVWSPSNFPIHPISAELFKNNDLTRNTMPKIAGKYLACNSTVVMPSSHFGGSFPGSPNKTDEWCEVCGTPLPKYPADFSDPPTELIFQQEADNSQEI